MKWDHLDEERNCRGTLHVWEAPVSKVAGPQPVISHFLRLRNEQILKGKIKKQGLLCGSRHRS